MPDNPQRSYNEALADARRDLVAGGGPRDRVLEGLYEAYARMLVDIQRDVDDETITEDRADALRASINQSLQQLDGRVDEILTNGRDEAIDLAIQAHREATAAAQEAAGATIEVGESFADVPDRVIQYALERRMTGGASTFRTLVRRNIQAAADDIDGAIMSAIGRGTSQQRLTKDIAAQLARSDDRLQSVLKQMGQLGREAAVGEGTTVLDEGDLSRARRLIYDARRIAVSEINSHYDEADKISTARSPVVDLVRWRTSRRHDGLDSSPDACDVLENADPHGYGEGLYHPETVPSLPHPHCMCRVESVLLDPEDWGNSSAKRPRPDRPSVTSDGVRDLMETASGGRSITDAHVESQRKMIEGVIDAIYDTPRRS